MKIKFIKTGIFAVVFFFGLHSQAQDNKGKKRGGGSPEKLIERLDVDKDGKLSLKEISEAKRGKFSENFKTIDTDSNGLIDVEELKVYMEENRRKK